MTKIVGILNLTPDSFSGDGLNDAKDEALLRIDAMIGQGIPVIDVGAESTRPGATPLSAEEEWQRLTPLVKSLGKRLQQVEFSIDTRHVQTAQKALEAGFRIINDVSGSTDAAMIALLKHYDCKLVVMHSLCIPADPSQVIAAGADPVEEVFDWGKRILATLEGQGIAHGRIIIDPGIGFGKTPQQSLALIRNIGGLKTLGVPLMVGHSRKSFLSLFTDKKADGRDAETLAVSRYLISQGVDYLRVHDTKGHMEMLRSGAIL